MDARTQRTVIRFVAVFLAAGAGDGIVQFLSDGRYDWRHLLAVLAGAAIIAFEQFAKNTGDNAPPSVAGVNSALLGVAAGNPLASVPPPKVTVPDPPVVTTLPPAP